jgi:hypothetical protein|eukprot:m.4468 g.4468  ORF g.4468 m.4468 type:complete len:136 (+) comp3369_c0_seq1:172-579(+)
MFNKRPLDSNTCDTADKRDVLPADKRARVDAESPYQQNNRNYNLHPQPQNPLGHHGVSSVPPGVQQKHDQSLSQNTSAPVYSPQQQALHMSTSFVPTCAGDYYPKTSSQYPSTIGLSVDYMLDPQAVLLARKNHR